MAVSIIDSVKPLTPKPNSSRLRRSLAASWASRSVPLANGRDEVAEEDLGVGEVLLVAPEGVVAVESHDRRAGCKSHGTPQDIPAGAPAARSSVEPARNLSRSFDHDVGCSKAGCGRHRPALRACTWRPWRPPPRTLPGQADRHDVVEVAVDHEQGGRPP